MSPAVLEKAGRYLAEGRLTVLARGNQTVRAICAGAGGKYAVTYSPGSGWWCSCPARRECCHLMAAQLVTTSRRADR